MGKAVSSLFSIADLPNTYTSLMSREVGGVCRVRKNLPPWYSSFSAFLLPAFHFYNNQITLENYMNIKSTHPHVFRSKIQYTFHVNFYLLFLYLHIIFSLSTINACSWNARFFSLKICHEYKYFEGIYLRQLFKIKCFP